VKVGASVIKREQCAVDIGNREPPAFNVDGHHPTARNRSDFRRQLLSHLVFQLEGLQVLGQIRFFTIGQREFQ
jgi:hypothetical protein